MKKRVLSFLMALTMVLGISSPAMAATAPETTDIVVQKLQYTLADPVDESPQIQNTGSEIENIEDFGVSNYDKSIYGDVGFTLYSLNKDEVIEELRSNNKTAQMIASDVADAINTNPTDLPYSATIVREEIIVDENGLVVFEDVPSNDDQIYVIVESRLSRLVDFAAEPMLVQLPIANAEGNGYLSRVYLYPKNTVRQAEQSLVKLSMDTNETVSNPVQNIQFDLYMGTPADYQNAVKVNEEPFVTSEWGMVVAKELVVGDYFFVEVETPNIVDGNSVAAEAVGSARDGVGELLAGHNGILNEHNTLTFTVGSDGGITASEDLEGYVNYQRPSLVKDIVDTEGNVVAEPNYDYDQDYIYRITTTVPQNVGDYTQYDVQDVMAPQVAFTPEVKNSLVADMTAKGFVENTDYSITETLNATGSDEFVISFTNNGIAKLSENKAADVNYEFSCNYTAQLSPTKKANVEITADETFLNTATLSYTNGPGAQMRYDNDEAEVITYGKRFMKLDDGLWSSGIVNQGIGGAQFIVVNSDNEILREVDGVRSWVADTSVVSAAGDSLVADGFVPPADMLVLEAAEDGSFSIQGLSAGTYSVIEIKAPEGFRLPIGNDGKTEFTVGPNTFNLADGTAAPATEIMNERTPELPMTGSEWLVVIGAGSIVLLAAAFIILKKKKKEEVEA